MPERLAHGFDGLAPETGLQVREGVTVAIDEESPETLWGSRAYALPRYQGENLADTSSGGFRIVNLRVVKLDGRGILGIGNVALVS